MKRLRNRSHRGTTACKPHTFRPLVEPLEDRMVPSTVMFQDNFGSGLSSNWQTFSASTNGSSTNMAGVYLLGQPMLGVDTHGGTSAGALAGQSSWTNYNYQAVVNLDNMKAGGVNLLARMQDGSHGYAFGYDLTLGEWTIALENGLAVTTMLCLPTSTARP
jgi:hypothetical protein